MSGHATKFGWHVPPEIEEQGIPWPYSLIANYARREGGELLPGPWERREIRAPGHRDLVIYIFPAWRES